MFKEEDRYGNKALHYACFFGYYEIAQKLMSMRKKTNICSENKDKMTPLHLAILAKQYGIANLLIDKGANINIKNHCNQTPLHLILNSPELTQFNHLPINYQLSKHFLNQIIDKEDRQLKIKLITKLLNLCARVGPRNYNKNSTLHIAAQYGDVDIAKVLLQNNPYLLNQQNSFQQLPIHQAALYGNLNMVKFLVQQGSPIEAPDKTKMTPLLYAVRKGHLDVVKFLIDRGADIELRNNFRHTPLLVACFRNQTEVAEYLIERGASINVQDQQKQTALNQAFKNKNATLIKHFIKYGTYIKIKSKQNNTADFQYVDIHNFRQVLSINKEIGDSCLQLANIIFQSQ